MENSKNKSIFYIFITVIFTALIVGGFSYYFYNNKIKLLKHELTDTTTVQMNVDSKTNCPSKYAMERAGRDQEKKENYSYRIAFKYPCGWDFFSPGGNTFKVSSPDGKASFSWPGPEMGLMPGFGPIEKNTININGKSYSIEKLKYNSGLTEELIIVDIPIPNEFPAFLLSYQNESYRNELEQILLSLEF